MTDLLTYRDSLLNTVPRWLKGKWGKRLLYSNAIQMDAMGDTLYDGVISTYPGLGDTNALALQGQARGIPRGISEVDATYTSRLIQWRRSRKRKGGVFALLEQVQAYLQSPTGDWELLTAIQTDNDFYATLSQNGFLYNGDYTGTNGVATVAPFYWNWDGGYNQGRFWVLLWATSGTLWVSDNTWADPGLWNDYNTSDGTPTGTPLDPLSNGDLTPTYGSTASYSTVQGLMSLIRDWTPPHATFMGVILFFDAYTWATLAPDGTWNLPGNRNPNAVYWDNAP